MKSAEGSGRKSPEDNDVSISIEQTFDDTSYKESNSPQKADDDISPASPSGNPSVASVPSEMNAPFLSISDTPKSTIPMLQIDSNASTLPQAGGSDTDVSLNQSMRQVGNGYSSMCQGTNCDAEIHMEDSFTSFQLGTMPYSGVISGEIRGTGLRTYVVLYLAALKGDWEIAKEFLNVNPQAACARITRGSETALHIAAGARHTRFVEELVKLMRSEDLAVQNKVGNTALCFAAASGIRKIAEVMVNKNNKLPSIRGSKGALPIYMATLLGHKDMVWYLYSVTAGEGVTEEDRISLLIASITANLFGLANRGPCCQGSLPHNRSSMLLLISHNFGIPPHAFGHETPQAWELKGPLRSPHRVATLAVDGTVHWAHNPTWRLETLNVALDVQSPLLSSFGISILAQEAGSTMCWAATMHWAWLSKAPSTLPTRVRGARHWCVLCVHIAAAVCTLCVHVLLAARTMAVMWSYLASYTPKTSPGLSNVGLQSRDS
ncbi:hypothetical protein Acr_00g0093490 [Actinidia rufa]|uniref:Ankyrin repeat family protein n=1 Tax=Actinidia rufa TaxID=165716 RepID=A0A7J0DXV1_9ERIC|nr:hypothetical protein Acr_00g0093490 [Actinidia rufa]